MYQIILVGAGQIGSRHLQALALSTIPYQITVVDPSQVSLNVTQTRLKQISNSVVQITFVTELPARQEYDLAIIATSAMDRFSVFSRLVELNKVTFVIFEKVLFQTQEHIDQTSALLKHHGINAWVNCARRSNLGYHKLQQVLQFTLPIKMVVSGQHYGLACNGIHFLDLFAFLINQPDIDQLNHRLDSEYVPTKRPGCYEVFGCLSATVGENSLEINCSNQDEAVTVKIEIRCNDRLYIIDEINQYMVELTLEGTVINNTEFVLQPQSQMTHIVVSDILSSGHCALPSYTESAALHRHYIRAFDDYFNFVSPGTFSACPIS